MAIAPVAFSFTGHDIVPRMQQAIVLGLSSLALLALGGLLLRPAR
jgi:hypothetical protein